MQLFRLVNVFVSTDQLRKVGGKILFYTNFYCFNRIAKFTINFRKFEIFIFLVQKRKKDHDESSDGMKKTFSKKKKKFKRQ